MLNSTNIFVQFIFFLDSRNLKCVRLHSTPCGQNKLFSPLLVVTSCFVRSGASSVFGPDHCPASLYRFSKSSPSVPRHPKLLPLASPSRPQPQWRKHRFWWNRPGAELLIARRTPHEPVSRWISRSLFVVRNSG